MKELRPFLLLVGIVAGYFLLRIAAMRMKHGVDLENVSWRMFWAAIVFDGIFKKYDSEAIITSGADGTHSRLSKHYAKNNVSGMVEALDFRTLHIHPSEVGPIAAEARDTLGKNYDIVIEKDHIHAEYDPK